MWAWKTAWESDYDSEDDHFVTDIATPWAPDQANDIQLEQHFYFRKRSVDASDEFFSESDDDWFESDIRDDNQTVSEECQNFTMPSLTPEQVTNLLPLAEKYKKEGFSSDVGKMGVFH